jgi:branched-chain amino acid transport system permease protein
MNQFIDLTLSGITSGAIYAAVALALVLNVRSTHIVNFAQGAMMMITTFLAYTVYQHAGSYWLAMAVAIGAGLIIGGVSERVLMRPVERRPQLDALVVTFGLLVLLQGIAGMIYGGSERSYPPAFGIRGFVVGGRRVFFAPNDFWTVFVVLVVMIALAVLFRFTSLGLRMRATAYAPDVARLLGVRISRLLTLGWALAVAVGAIAGVLVAPSSFVSPNAFDAILVFGFTAAVIGGLESPPGAVVGGLGLGLALSYVAGYVGPDVVTAAAMIILIAVLMVRPSGLFGTAAGRRV